MSKLVTIIGLIAAFFIIKHLITGRSGSKTINERQDANSKPESLEYTDTVQCGYCGTHITEANSFKSGSNYYCNEEHYKKSMG